MTRTPFSYDLLHPKVRQSFQILEIRLQEGHSGGFTKTLFKPFEGYRTPQHQLAAKVRGVSKAGPWESAHNYGLAVDFVPWVDGKWSWDGDHDWDFLRDCATNRGLLNNISWDRPHVEHVLWREVRQRLGA